MKPILFIALFAASLPACAQAAFDGDTPVEKIAANPDGAAVLNRDIPGLLGDAQYPLFKTMSLKQLQEASDGELSADMVNKAVADLQALAPPPPASPPASPPSTDSPSAPAPSPMPDSPPASPP